MIDNLSQLADYIRPDTFVVVATHGNYDELALEKILKAKPAYVGLVASSKRFQDVQAYLMGQGLSETDLKILKAPAGLDIQARRSDEIALSIMAEIVQLRRNRRQILELPVLQNHEHRHAGSAIAIDPVCLMEVEIATAKYTYEHEGTMYYFCAPGCKRSFSKNPRHYLFATDPICGMEVEIATAQYHVEFDGTNYYFCGEGCKATFEKNPQAHIHVSE
jgi:xanthine dehydrogenase accessory factor